MKCNDLHKKTGKVIQAIILALCFSLIALSCVDIEKKEQQRINDSIAAIKAAIKRDSIKKAFYKRQDSLYALQGGRNYSKEAKELSAAAKKLGRDWDEFTCWRILHKEVWIGMTYDMLVHERGGPNHTNVSNYGNGKQYQWCWDDYTPSCCYAGEDKIITAYN